MTNNDKTETQKTSPTMLVAYQVTERGEGKKKQSYFNRIGIAFPHQNGKGGFNIQLNAIPLDGKIVLLTPREKEEEAS
jgi:hypothetical protein